MMVIQKNLIKHQNEANCCAPMRYGDDTITTKQDHGLQLKDWDDMMKIVTKMTHKHSLSTEILVN